MVFETLKALARGAVLSALALLVAGCEEERTLTEIELACARSSAGALEVRATFAQCLHGGCNTVESASCELSVDDQQVTVQGASTIRTKTSEFCDQQRSCEAAAATCSLELPEGFYTIEGVTPAFVVEHPTSEWTCSDGSYD